MKTELPLSTANGPETGQNTDRQAGVRCDQIHELIPAYSVGATDADENARFAKELAGCPDAAKTLASYADFADQLLYAVTPVAPPSSLEARLLAAMQHGAPIAANLSAPRTATAESPLPSQPPAQRTWAFTWHRSPIWALTSAAILLILVGLNLYLLGQNQKLQQQYEALLAIQMQARQQNALHSLFASDTRQTIGLPAAQENSQASAEIIWDPTLDVAMLYATSFPPLTQGQVYQLWLTRAGQRASGGLFTVDSDGTGVLIFPPGQRLDQLDSMGVTTEPSGGSPGPTSPPVVRRRFTS